MFEFSIVGFGKPEWADFPTFKCLHVPCHEPLICHKMTEVDPEKNKSDGEFYIFNKTKLQICPVFLSLVLRPVIQSSLQGTRASGLLVQYQSGCGY